MNTHDDYQSFRKYINDIVCQTAKSLQLSPSVIIGRLKYISIRADAFTVLEDEADHMPPDNDLVQNIVREADAYHLRFNDLKNRYVRLYRHKMGALVEYEFSDTFRNSLETLDALEAAERKKATIDALRIRSRKKGSSFKFI